MSAAMIVDAIRKQFEATGEALTAWRPADAESSERTGYLEDAILVFLDRPSTMRRLVGRLWERQRAGKIPNPLQTWHDISILFDLTLRQAGPLRDLLTQARDEGQRVERADEFDQAVRDLGQLQDEFRRTFPVATPEEVAEDRAAIAGGHHRDAAEAFAQAAGVDLETWRRRVAEYEARDHG